MVAAHRRVAFLRGINVGGAGLLKMADLRRLAEGIGLREAMTVGASGNLLYTSGATAKGDEVKLVKALVGHMGKGAVVVRDAAAMSALVAQDPFRKADAAIPDKWRFIAFLATPSDAPLPSVPGDHIRLLGRTPREVFYTMSEPTAAAINVARVLEKGLATAVTVRNWNVVRDLAQRLDAAR